MIEPKKCAQTSWTMLESISHDFGPDFYLLDEVRFAGNLRHFRKAFEQHVPQVRPAYSVKTNYLPVFVRTAAQHGWYNEVVSGFEYDLIRSLGVPGPDIIFNGPVKSDSEIDRAVGEGALLNADTLTELKRIDDRATASTPARIALRCSLDIDGSDTRFGIPAAHSDFRHAIALCRSSECLDLEGLHAHYCHPGKAPAAYTAQAEALRSLIQIHGLGGTLQHLNLGGGFFSPMPASMAAQFGGDLPDAADYAAAICGPLKTLLTTTGIELILEPGLIVVADCMRFATKVHDIKPVSWGQEVIITGGVYNVKPGKSRLDIPFEVVARAQRPNPVYARVSGFTCMEDDVLHRASNVHAAPGDFLVFENCGAYTNVLKPPFIRLSPPVLSLHPDGTATVLVRAETTQDITMRFV